MDADQPTTTEPSVVLTPEIVGALGESPKVSEDGRVAVPPEVDTVTSTVPPVIVDGLIKLSVVPSVLSVQLVTVFAPTVIAETPTRKLPFKVTVAPPVFGIVVLFDLAMEGDCTKA